LRMNSTPRLGWMSLFSVTSDKIFLFKIFYCFNSTPNNFIVVNYLGEVFRLKFVFKLFDCEVSIQIIHHELLFCDFHELLYLAAVSTTRHRVNCKHRRLRCQSQIYVGSPSCPPRVMILSSPRSSRAGIPLYTLTVYPLTVLSEILRLTIPPGKALVPLAMPMTA